LRPTASRTCGKNRETQKQNQTQIPCTCRSPLEKTMEADISIFLETGHFYFALTLFFGSEFVAWRPARKILIIARRETIIRLALHY